MHTRQDYLDKKCTHREYNAQFVIPSTIARVVSSIGGEDIMASTSQSSFFDGYVFNDIALERWNWVAKSLPVGGPNIEEVDDYWSQAGLVCVAKEAARQWRENQHE